MFYCWVTWLKSIPTGVLMLIMALYSWHLYPHLSCSIHHKMLLYSHLRVEWCLLGCGSSLVIWQWLSAGAGILGWARDVSDIVSDNCNVNLSIKTLIALCPDHGFPNYSLASVLTGWPQFLLNWGKSPMNSRELALEGNWLLQPCQQHDDIVWCMWYVVMTVLQHWRRCWHEQVERLPQRVFYMK